MRVKGATAMTTQVVQPPRKREALIFPKVNWQQFEAIAQSFESILGVKFRYVDGVLEIIFILGKLDGEQLT